jgi:hypothetical protein
MPQAVRSVNDVPVIEHRDLVLDWELELMRLAPHLADLPEPAQAAVAATVASFLREDAESTAPGRLESAA